MSARVCGHCGAENDNTRVYCLDCGARLPEPVAEAPGVARSASVRESAPPLVGGGAPPLPRPPRRKPPGKARAGQSPTLVALAAKMLFSTAVLAAVLAAMIQMAREPDNIPKAVGKNFAAAQETQFTLKQMAAATQPTSWMVNGGALDEFLATTIEMEPSTLSTHGLGAEFQRAFVRLGSGRAALGLEQKFLTRSIYFLLEVEPEKAGDGVAAKVVGGSIGRLPVHPRLLPVFQRLFSSTITALDPSLELVRTASSVTITPEDVKLEWSGKPSS